MSHHTTHRLRQRPRTQRILPRSSSMETLGYQSKKTNQTTQYPHRLVQHVAELMLQLQELHVRAPASSHLPARQLMTNADRPKSPTNDVHSLVPSIPSPTPSELGPAAMKQLMTWGTLNATPRVLSQSDDPPDIPTPATPFRIAEPSSRERLSHKLSSDAAKSLRAKAGLLGNVPLFSKSSTSSGRRTSMPPPSWTPRKAEAPGSLTPAAKRLLDRSTMGTAASRRADAMGRLAGWEGDNRREKDLQKVRWTPTPSPVARRG